eukprot:4609530-Pleurochrysis_carterae.AAC.1
MARLKARVVGAAPACLPKDTVEREEVSAWMSLDAVGAEADDDDDDEAFEIAVDDADSCGIAVDDADSCDGAALLRIRPNSATHCAHARGDG